MTYDQNHNQVSQALQEANQTQEQGTPPQSPEEARTEGQMTFTSIPPSLRPVVEDVARALYERDQDDNGWPVAWEDLDEMDEPHIKQAMYLGYAEAAILAFLNACVERGVGRVSDVRARNSERVVATRIILNLGATDDTA